MNNSRLRKSRDLDDESGGNERCESKSGADTKQGVAGCIALPGGVNADAAWFYQILDPCENSRKDSGFMLATLSSSLCSARVHAEC